MNNISQISTFSSLRSIQHIDKHIVPIKKVRFKVLRISIHTFIRLDSNRCMIFANRINTDNRVFRSTDIPQHERDIHDVYFSGNHCTFSSSVRIRDILKMILFFFFLSFLFLSILAEKNLHTYRL
jgi:hypothetical protein